MKMASVFKPEILDLITKDDVDIDSLITRMVGRQTDIESRQSISKYVKESDNLQRIKRDGGYGHQCSQPFVIFPFLIFLQSLATTTIITTTTITTIIITITTTIIITII